MRSSGAASSSRPGTVVKRETMPTRASDDSSSSTQLTTAADEFGVVVKQERQTRVIRTIPGVAPWNMDEALNVVSPESFIDETYTSLVEVWPHMLKAFYFVFKGSTESDVSPQFRATSGLATTASFTSVKPAARASSAMRARSGAASSSSSSTSSVQKLFSISKITTGTGQILPFTDFGEDNNYKVEEQFKTELNPNWFDLDVGSRQIVIRVFAKVLTNLLLWNEYILHANPNAPTAFTRVYNAGVPDFEREIHDTYIQNFQTYPWFLEELLRDVSINDPRDVPVSVFLLSKFLDQMQEYASGITASIMSSASAARSAISQFHSEKVDIANAIIDLGSFYSLMSINDSIEDKLMEAYQKFLQTLFAKAKDLTEFEKLIVSVSVFETYYNSNYLDLKTKLAARFGSSPRVSFEKVYVFFLEYIQAVFSKSSEMYNRVNVIGRQRPEYKLDENLRKRILQHRDSVFKAAAEAAAKKKT